jgi:hypothetical protein
MNTQTKLRLLFEGYLTWKKIVKNYVKYKEKGEKDVLKVKRLACSNIQKYYNLCQACHIAETICSICLTVNYIGNCSLDSNSQYQQFRRNLTCDRDHLAIENAGQIAIGYLRAFFKLYWIEEFKKGEKE